MGAYERQYKKLLAREMLRHMVGLGRLPNTTQIASAVSRALGRDKRALYKYVSQPRKQLFQNEVYNSSMLDIKFDIETLHEELISLYQESIQRFNYADLYHKVHSHELSNLKSKLEMLLFTIEDADFYFLGAFDNFTDTTKLDFQASTSNILDLSENAVVLPYGGRNTARVDASHLFSAGAWPVTVVSPPSSAIIREGLTPSSAFGNIFSDLVNAWTYEVVVSEQVPVEIVFKFPLASGSAEVFVNRVEFSPHSGSKQRLTMKTSNDDVNYLPVVGYEEGIDIEDQRKIYAMDFDTTLIEYIEVTLRKESPDAETVDNSGNKTWQYLFGLKSFSALTTGRVQKGNYQSLPFEFDEIEQISMVSLQANSIKPKGTNISYAVALADTSGPVSSFIPITPIGQGSSGTLGSSEVINFGTTVPNKKKIAIIGTALQYGNAYKGKNMYKVGDEVSPPPVFGSASLLRGFQVWSRDQTSAFQVISINDLYVPFQATDIEYLYTTATESISANQANIVANGLSKDTTLTVANAVYYDSSKGHTLKPAPGQNPTGNIKPNYAVYSVTQTSVQKKFTNTAFSRPSQNTVALPSANFILNTVVVVDQPVISNSGTGTIYVEGIDFTYDTVSVGGVLKPTGLINIIVGSGLDQVPVGHTLFFTYTVDTDVTHKVAVIGAVSPSSVLLRDAKENVGGSDVFVIKYRFVPVSPSEIIKPSIQVKSQPSSSTAGINLYIEGTDYVVDPGSGAIQRMPTGRIPSTGEVYVDYQYRDAQLGIETFLTWCHIPSTVPIQLRFEVDTVTKKNKLVADTSVGESFFISTPQGLIDLTSATATPFLEPGWLQFIVRSKNPEANKQWQSNLIDQVIQIRDVNRNKIFKERSTYFDQIIAFRQPLVQRTLNDLRVNTLPSDHTVFAIDDITTPGLAQPVVSFEPNQEKDLYLYVPTSENVADNVPLAYHEVYELLWSIAQPSGAEGDRIIVRIELSRDINGIDGGITPKVFDYSLRASL